MEGYRLNPVVGINVSMDKSDAEALNILDETAKNYLAKNTALLDKVVASLTTAPNIKQKALKSLAAGLKMLKLSQALETHEKNHIANPND